MSIIWEFTERTHFVPHTNNLISRMFTKMEIGVRFFTHSRYTKSFKILDNSVFPKKTQCFKFFWNVIISSLINFCKGDPVMEFNFLLNILNKNVSVNMGWYKNRFTYNFFQI